MKLKDLYIEFFESKEHKHIPSAPLVPENDPTALFNTAGMQPLIPYLMGQKHPLGKRLVNYQKCLRTSDLESVGNNSHHTFFEQLGNWSLGDYFREESIIYSFEFLTDCLNVPIDKLAVSVFEGTETIPRDEAAADVWKKLGIKPERIAYLGMEENFWACGETGPCGSDSEIFYWRSNEPVPEKFDPEDTRWCEIWNNVFMEFERDENGNLISLPEKNIDTGMGLERTVAALEGVDDNYLSSVWIDVTNKISEVANISYEGNEVSMRIIADHIRAAIFILADPAEVRPSNTEQGYVLRKLLRRAIRHAKKLNININSDWEQKIATVIINQFRNYYTEIDEKDILILEELEKEKNRFNKTLEKGLREFEKISNSDIDATNAFRLYDTFGFPIELTEELATEKGLKVDVEGFKQKFREHQEKSRAGAENKFKGGMAGNSEIETKYHTMSHLLNAALKVIVDDNVHQKGSNITSERMRFDFSCDRKLTDEEKREVEILVNKWIQDDIPIIIEEMTKEEAIGSGAECMFVEKYPDIVNVYNIGDISKELCGGPHVDSTGLLGKFKIVKEEASSAGVRRIKAVME